MSTTKKSTKSKAGGISDAERAKWERMLSQMGPKERRRFEREVRKMKADPVEMLRGLAVLFMRMPREMQDRLLLVFGRAS